MSIYPAVGGLFAGLALSAANVVLIWKANKRESVAMPALLPFLPLVLNVLSIHHIPMAPQIRQAGYISAVALELSIDIIWPFAIREWFNGMTPLHRAARSGKKALVERLLDGGADIDARDGNGWSAVEMAAWRGHTEVVDALASRGAELGAWKKSVWKTRFDTLGMAASAGRLQVVKLLVEKHNALNEVSQHGHTALQAAAFRRRRNIVRYLLEHGASVRPSSAEAGDSLVHLAAQQGDIEMLRELMARGADVNARNGMGMTPLKMASTQPCRNRKAVERILRENHAHV